MSAACEELGVSRSLYYQLRKRFLLEQLEGHRREETEAAVSVLVPLRRVGPEGEEAD